MWTALWTRCIAPRLGSMSRGRATSTFKAALGRQTSDLSLAFTNAPIPQGGFMRLPLFLFRLFPVFLAIAGMVAAQETKPAQAAPPAPPVPVVSPEVHADGSVTFRLRAPNVQEVKVAREGTQPVAMQKDDQGVWSVT